MQRASVQSELKNINNETPHIRRYTGVCMVLMTVRHAFKLYQENNNDSTERMDCTINVRVLAQI